ncbi:MAG: hypothetical protein A2Y16_04440 [Tenericutes bacterium GWF2_57_13]|nr:MAG: hypothetical protein A2Y16_04440 [Tenericutes bacterium GWF2_57_13]
MFNSLKMWLLKIKTKAAFKKIVKDHNHQSNDYLRVTREALLHLPESELYAAASAITEDIINKHEEIIDGVNEMNDAQKAFYVTSYYEMEVNNGGLCQFFVNSSRAVAPLLSHYLEAIGAIEHKRLFDTFLKNNQIDVNDLSSFIVDDVAEFQQQTKRYPFDEYDDNFYQLKSIESFLIDYLKRNLNNI